jgi:cell division septation protein DedD
MNSVPAANEKNGPATGKTDGSGTIGDELGKASTGNVTKDGEPGALAVVPAGKGAAGKSKKATKKTKAKKKPAAPKKPAISKKPKPAAAAGKAKPKGKKAKPKKLPKKKAKAAKGKQQGIGAFCESLLKQKKSTDEILAAVRSKFPDAKTSPASVAWYRNKMREEGTLPKS